MKYYSNYRTGITEKVFIYFCDSQKKWIEKVFEDDKSTLLERSPTL